MEQEGTQRNKIDKIIIEKRKQFGEERRLLMEMYRQEIFVALLLLSLF